MSALIDTGPSWVPWNKGRLTGQKPPLKLKEIWAIRVRLQRAFSHGLDPLLPFDRWPPKRPLPRYQRSFVGSCWPVPRLPGRAELPQTYRPELRTSTTADGGEKS
jgi:hypothetical protein